MMNSRSKTVSAASTSSVTIRLDHLLTSLYSYELPHCRDANHVQLIEQDATAMVSCRATNSFLKVDVASKRTTWALGGRWGNFTLYDLDGRAYAPGTSLWHGQHNAEWFGEQPGNASAGATVSEVLVFDNARGRS